MTKLKIAITGGAGFIGSNAVRYFDSAGYPVHVVDCFTYAADINRVRHGIPIFWGEISAMHWAAFLKECTPDVIINYAAFTHVDRSLIASEADKFVRSNITGVHRIISEIRRYQQETKKKIFLVHVSTDEVLGDIPLDKNVEYDEEQPLHPNNFYAATKASAELVIKSMHHTYKDFDFVIVRASNNYGPNQHQEKFIPTVISKILKGEKIPIYGNGDNVREWLWVDDFTRGIEAVIENYLSGVPIASETFHFGSSTRIDNFSLVNMIIALMDASPELTSFVADRPGHDKKYALNCEKAKQVLGWAPVQILEAGLAEVIKDIRLRAKRGYIS